VRCGWLRARPQRGSHRIYRCKGLQTINLQPMARTRRVPGAAGPTLNRRVRLSAVMEAFRYRIVTEWSDEDRASSVGCRARRCAHTATLREAAKQAREAALAILESMRDHREQHRRPTVADTRAATCDCRSHSTSASHGLLPSRPVINSLLLSMLGKRSANAASLRRRLERVLSASTAR